MTTAPWIKIICALAVSGVVLAGCGRKGPLDRPGVSSTPVNTADEATDPAPVKDRSFILDGLLD